MGFSTKTILFSFFVGAWLSVCPPVYGQGSIRGRVVDLDGRAIPQALVSAERFDGLSASAVQEVPTDANGEFLIANVFPGPYHVVARKEDEGYGDNRSGFYNARPSPLVSVTEAKAHATVTVVLGPKAAFLSGTIVEDATGEPAAASVVMWRLQEPDKPIGISVGPNFRVLIPSGAEIGVKLISNGHEAWIIEGGSLHMEPGASKSVAVRLAKKY